MAELRLLDCDTCGEPIPVKVILGEWDGNTIPISVMRADYLAAQLEHDLAQETCHE
jgi:hypothetical protein